MHLPQTFNNRQFRASVMVAGVLGLFYLFINIFMLGGDAFVYQLNTSLTPPLAVLTAIMAGLLWQQMRTGVQNRLQWGSLLIGWILWAVAEILWLVFSFFGYTPYPSWADLFFVIGYIPMSFGFFSRIRTLPKHKKWSGFELVVAWCFSLAVLLFMVGFVLPPIIQDYDPQRLLESILNLFYPLADLFMLLLVVYLLFTYGSGEYGFSWRLILAGFITVTVSDLFYSYASWNDLYYPDSKATLLSTLVVDGLYILSYTLWMLGNNSLRVVLGEHQTFKISYQSTPVPSAHILLYTKKDETLIDISRNYYSFFPHQDVKGKSLAEVLGMSSEQGDILHEKLMSEKRLTDEAVQISGSFGTQPGWLSGMAILDEEGRYSGATLVMRTLNDEDGFNDLLSDHQKQIVSYVLTKSGIDEKGEIKQFLLDYHLIYIKSLFNLTIREGGAPLSQQFLDELQSIARENDWKVGFNPQNLLDGSLAAPEILRVALPALVGASKQFAIRISDSMTVEALMQSINSQIGEVIHKRVKQYESFI